MNENSIYLTAKEHLGLHLTLNTAVPDELGCCESVSSILLKAGYDIPQTGIAGVNALIAWLLANGFKESSVPSVGCVITAHASDETDTSFAHAGIVLLYGIGSNNSNNGIFSENFSIKSWDSYFGGNGSVTRFFLPVDNQVVPTIQN